MVEMNDDGGSGQADRNQGPARPMNRTCRTETETEAEADMGERVNGAGVPGRRRVRPGDASSGLGDPSDDAALELALAAVLRGGDLGPEAEQRAVTAFVAARGAGAHRARTRRRDDWRLPEERRAGRSVKTTFAAVFASLALGGVAVAAIGSVGSSADGTGADRRTPHPSVTAPTSPGGEASSAPSDSPDRRTARPPPRTSRPTAAPTSRSRSAARRSKRRPGSGSSRRRAARARSTGTAPSGWRGRQPRRASPAAGADPARTPRTPARAQRVTPARRATRIPATPPAARATRTARTARAARITRPAAARQAAGRASNRS